MGRSLGMNLSEHWPKLGQMFIQGLDSTLLYVCADISKDRLLLATPTKASLYVKRVCVCLSGVSQVSDISLGQTLSFLRGKIKHTLDQ